MRRMLTIIFGTLLLAASAHADGRADKKNLNVMAEAGVASFTGDLGDVADAGPAWGLILNLQPTRMLGLEVGYDASRHRATPAGTLANVPALTDAEGPVLLRNGGTAMLKIGPPLLDRYKPWVGVGFGASYVNVLGGATGVYRNDMLQSVPFAAGLEFNTEHVTAGLRARYSSLIGEGFANGAGGNTEGGMLDGAVTVGGRF